MSRARGGKRWFQSAGAVYANAGQKLPLSWLQVPSSLSAGLVQAAMNAWHEQRAVNAGVVNFKKYIR